MDADGHVPKFGIFQNTVAPNCSKLLMFWSFLKKRFCLMSDLKITLSNITSFLPDSLSELKKVLYSGLNTCQTFDKGKYFFLLRFLPVFSVYFRTWEKTNQKKIIFERVLFSKSLPNFSQYVGKSSQRYVKNPV